MIEANIPIQKLVTWLKEMKLELASKKIEAVRLSNGRKLLPVEFTVELVKYIGV